MKMTLHVENSEPNSKAFGSINEAISAYRRSGLVVEQLLIQPENDVNLTGRRGRSLLYLACEEGHVYFVKLLHVNKAGATALIVASRHGQGSGGGAAPPPSKHQH